MSAQPDGAMQSPAETMCLEHLTLCLGQSPSQYMLVIMTTETHVIDGAPGNKKDLPKVTCN
jgi:hypothetical protein